MATLTNCPTCGKQVSSKAATCPNCGEVLHHSKSETAINLKDPVHLLGVLISILVLAGVGVAIVYAILQNM